MPNALLANLFRYCFPANVCLQADVEVEELTPLNPHMLQTMTSMKERGIDLVYGRWLIEGAPRVLLIDTSTGYKHLGEWKSDLWNIAGIPSPEGDGETNEAIVFGYMVAWFLGEVCWKLPACSLPYF